jgi:predicted glutamine amidotransferase
MSRDFDLVFESHILTVIHFIPYLNKIEACHPFYSENKIEACHPFYSENKIEACHPFYSENKIEACHPFYSENKIEMLFIHAVISQCQQ